MRHVKKIELSRRAWHVIWHSVDARPLVTIRLADGQPEIERMSSVGDAFVRVFPAHDTESSAITQLRTDLEGCGAAKVAVMPRAAAPRTVLVDKRKQLEFKGPASIRAVVMQLVEAANLNVDREQVRAFVDGKLTQAKL